MGFAHGQLKRKISHFPLGPHLLSFRLAEFLVFLFYLLLTIFCSSSPHPSHQLTLPTKKTLKEKFDCKEGKLSPPLFIWICQRNFSFLLSNERHLQITFWVFESFWCTSKSILYVDQNIKHTIYTIFQLHQVLFCNFFSFVLFICCSFFVCLFPFFF